MKSTVSKPDAKVTILAMFQREVRPVLIGQAAIALKWPLAWTEEVFDELVDERKIRLCTKKEAYDFDVTHGYFLVT